MLYQSEQFEQLFSTYFIAKARKKLMNNKKIEKVVQIVQIVGSARGSGV